MLKYSRFRQVSVKISRYLSPYFVLGGVGKVDIWNFYIIRHPCLLPSSPFISLMIITTGIIFFLLSTDSTSVAISPHLRGHKDNKRYFTEFLVAASLAAVLFIMLIALAVVFFLKRKKRRQGDCLTVYRLLYY